MDESNYIAYIIAIVFGIIATIVKTRNKPTDKQDDTNNPRTPDPEVMQPLQQKKSVKTAKRIRPSKERNEFDALQTEAKQTSAANAHQTDIYEQPSEDEHDDLAEEFDIVKAVIYHEILKRDFDE